VLLLGPADKLFKQLRDESQPQNLPKWLSYLTNHAERGSGARVAILVSSLDAAFLRRRGVTRFREIAMHLILHRELRSAEPQDSASYAEFLKLVGQELPPHQLGFFDRVVGRLGADLRLISEWIGWVKHQYGDTELERFCEEPGVVELIRRELASLTALDYLMVVAGTTTKTRLERGRVKAGQVAAEDYYSSTEQYQRKRLQAAGQPFSRVTLQRIASDPASPPNLRVQGFGSASTPVESLATVMQVVTSLGPKERESRLRRLADLGFGSWVSGVFRTRSPYREYLTTLHDRHSAAGIVHQVNRAYQALVGPDRWLAEALGPADLRGWKAQELTSFMPQARRADAEMLLRLAALWRNAGSTAEVDSALAALFAPYPLRRPDDAERLAWADLEARGCGVYRLYREATTVPTDAVVWAGQPGIVDIETLSLAARTAAHGGPKFPLIALGPGVEHLGPDDARRVAHLRFGDLREAACRGDLLKESLRKVRSHLDLKLLSPFQTSGALPPGSPLFVGREEERRFIQANIRSKSILIVGARRIGKTSLLNYVYHWAGQQPDLQPIHIDLQGAGSVPEFCSRLGASLRADHPGLLSVGVGTRGGDDAFALLRETISVVEKNGKRVIFLFNEIDRIAASCPGLIETWKGMHEGTKARFVMVGYSVIGDLGDVTKALFQFTEGDRYGRRALALTTIEPQAAREILDLLTGEPLWLRWPDNEEREQCYRELLDRSYCIPWVLQRYAVALVERMEARRSDTLCYDDVRAVSAQGGGEVWRYLDGIDYDKLGHPGAAEALRRGFQLVLFALVRWRYFLGGARAPIRDPRLRSLQALDPGLGFTEAEAYEIVQRTLADLLHGREEQEYFEQWFSKLDLKQVFRLLTLTLALESDPSDARRYGFLLHMLPIEIWRQYHRQDPTLDTKIVDFAIEFLRYSRHTRAELGRGT